MKKVFWRPCCPCAGGVTGSLRRDKKETTKETAKETTKETKAADETKAAGETKSEAGGKSRIGASITPHAEILAVVKDILAEQGN